MDFLKSDDPLQTRITPTRWALSMAEWIKTFLSFPEFKKRLTIIQGDDDQTVDFKFNIPAICEKFPNSSLIMIKEGRHQLLNESPEFREKIFAHVSTWLNGEDEI